MLLFSGRPWHSQVDPLPPPPTRDQLCRVKAAFNGDVSVTTGQLGTVPSWGPEVWMLSALNDRVTTYNAHKAWGATHIVVGVSGNYTEAGVVYPNNCAMNNDFTNDMETFVLRVVEIINNDLIPVIAMGGDNGYDYIYNNLPAYVNALKTYPDGDLTRYVVFLSGFDSIDSIGLQQYQDGGVTESNMLQFFRTTVGPDACVAKEMWSGTPPIWQFPPSPTWEGIDVFLFETAGLMLGNEQAPQIVSGAWDSEHNDYAPTYDKSESSWTIPWQTYRRMFSNYSPPSDQPYNKDVPVTGSATDPNYKGIQPVSSDTQGSVGIYTQYATPRGRQYCVAFEFGTYAMTHGQATAAQVQATRNYLQSMNPDACC